MNETVIHVEGLGKRYRVGERERYYALRDVLTRAFLAPFRRKRRRPQDHLWALRDVTFDIRQGEVVGLIGRNGAGKTTLLKLLSRITRPTVGFAEIRGRVGSLIEVGTGFHPELTGRENVYLSGAILGMKKNDIERRFDEIVAFAQVERFIDTPLKHFSTGMQMRLAFAVAAHLEPEILLVDEVLAVGDLQFQRKCLGKMEDVSHSGRTIVFVSHQMNQIRRLCERAIWVDGGRLRLDGPAKQVVNDYEAAALRMETSEIEQEPGSVAFRRWLIGHTQSNQLDLDDLPEKIVVKFQAVVKAEISKGILVVSLRSDENAILWSAMYPDLQIKPGPLELNFSFANLPLNPGIYFWEIRVHDGHQWFDHMQVPEFSVVANTDTDVYGYLKGALNLDVSFDLLDRTEYKLERS
jgi:lipopolysaccharide transport system ATP-binding protein